MSHKTSSWFGIDKLRRNCLGLTFLDLETLPAVEGEIFSPREREKFLNMGPRRLKSFMAARIALKGLARELGLIEKSRSDQTIETLGDDNEKPCLGQSGVYCSVSHSPKFVVAVAQVTPVGVDIEAVSDKILRIRHLFLSSKEQQLVGLSTPDLKKTATRIWTIKEASAKALGLHLFQALREVEVIKTAEEESVMIFKNKPYSVLHGEGEGQVISLVTSYEHV